MSSMWQPSMEGEKMTDQDIREIKARLWDIQQEINKLQQEGQKLLKELEDESK